MKIVFLIIQIGTKNKTQLFMLSLLSFVNEKEFNLLIF